MAKQGLLFLTILALLTACKRDLPTQWEVDGLVPLAHGKVGLADLLPDSMLTTNDEGVLHLRIDENLTDFDLDSLVEIPDTTIRESFTPGFPWGPVTLPPGTSVLNQEDESVFAISAVELKRVSMKGGFMEFSVKNYMDGQLVLSYALPGATKGGVPVEIEEVLLPGSGENPSVYTGNIPLEGYTFDFTGTSGNGSNTMVSIFGATVDPNGPGDALIYGTDSLVVEVRFVEPEVRYALGYFGEHEIAIRDTMNLELMQSLAGGSLLLDEIDLSFDIVNRVGADAQIEINGIKGKNTASDNVVEVQNDALFDQINITRAFDNNGSIEPTYYSFQLDESNSNITEFVSNLPDALILDIDLHVNPLGNVSASNDFIYTEEPMDAQLIADIPLCVSMENLKIQDTLSIESAIDMQASGKVFLYAENAFPFAATVSISVVDASGAVQATFASDQQLLSGVYDSVSFDVEGSSSIVEFELLDGSLASIQPENTIVVSVEFDTFNNEEVKFTESNYIDFNIVADFAAYIEIE